MWEPVTATLGSCWCSFSICSLTVQCSTFESVVSSLVSGCRLSFTCSTPSLPQTFIDQFEFFYLFSRCLPQQFSAIAHLCHIMPGSTCVKRVRVRLQHDHSGACGTLCYFTLTSGPVRCMIVLWGFPRLLPIRAPPETSLSRTETYT